MLRSLSLLHLHSLALVRVPPGLVQAPLDAAEVDRNVLLAQVAPGETLAHADALVVAHVERVPHGGDALRVERRRW